MGSLNDLGIGNQGERKKGETPRMNDLGFIAGTSSKKWIERGWNEEEDGFKESRDGQVLKLTVKG